MPEILLHMTDINYTYKGHKPALDKVSLDVCAGEFTALAGRNGSGKTTLTRLIMALLKPSGGSISFQGQDTATLTPADMSRYIGYVFQNPDRQIFRDTVFREVSYGPEQLGFTSAAIKEAVTWALAVTGLTEQAAAFPRTLSRGHKQKVAIASALAMRPKMLILDEPTSGQDPWETSNLMELLSQLNSQGITVALVTHDMEIINRYTKRVVVLDSGRKAFDGTPAELFCGGKDISFWGLAAPAAVTLAKRLGCTGVSTELELITTLASQLAKGREYHA